MGERTFFDNVGTQGKLSVLAINKNFARLRELLDGPLQGLNELCDQGCKEEVSTKLLLSSDTSRMQALEPLTMRLTSYAARASNETRTT
jgi:hypothetical protein